MKKWLIVSVIVIFIVGTLLSSLLLFSGQGNEQQVEPTNTTVVVFPSLITPSPETQSSTQKLTQEQIDYINEYITQYNACESDGAIFFTLIKEAKQDTTLLQDENFLIQLLKELTTFEEYCTHFGSETVIAGMETINENLFNVNESYSLFAEYFRTGMQTSDQTYIDKSDEYLQAGNQYKILVEKEITELTN